jgi:signal transduction histidine kinase
LLAIMREEAGRLEQLVRELLDFARPLVPALEPEPLDSVLVGAVDAASRAIGASAPAITVEIVPDLPKVRIDASMIHRAVVNLVVNACQAAGPGGRITVRAWVDRRAARRFARIDVTDSGPGIPPELRSRIFEPFFTTKATGTGLGLAVVKSIVESHGGEIEVVSAVGEATTLSLLLPIDVTRSDSSEPSVRIGW